MPKNYRNNSFTSLRNNYANFQESLPRSISGVPLVDRGNTKQAAGLNMGDMATLAALSGGQIYRNPSRRLYDPELSTSAIYMPRSIKQKNRWRRWFFDHDEFIGAVLELHAELPHSRAEIMCEDKMIKQHVEDCFDKTQLFSKLPFIDLEYMKVGETFIHTPWDDNYGMWSHIIIHNPDFVEVTASPFVEDSYIIELIPDDELKAIVNSTKPQDQQLKRRLPIEVIKRVTSGRNLILKEEEVTHLARRSNPYDLRGTSILDRLFRLLMYEDKLREAQITIADNFIYPLKLFKLGDPQKGWIPNESHQQALAQMLQQASLDPNFALIYHYGLQVEYLTVSDKVMRLDPEWNEINNKKAIALGVSQQFITGETTYASANVGLQTQLARYKAKRDLFEISWIRNKFLKVMAERNEWYRRDKKELVGNYRVTRSAQEKMERLIIPKLVWHKKLMMRDDQAFLTFLHNVYANGKGPLSSITLLQAMGLEIEDELTRKKIQEELEDRYGVYVQPPAGGSSGLPSLGAKLKNMITRQGKATEESAVLDNSEFTGYANESKNYLSKTAQEKYEDSFDRDTFEYYKSYVVDDNWLSKLSSNRLPDVVQSLFRKAEEVTNSKDLELILHKLYDQGKSYSHNKTGFMPYSNFKVSGLLKPGDYRDYSDTVNCTKLSDWFTLIHKEGESLNRNQVRGLFISAFTHGQLTGYEEQGIFNVRVTNVPSKDGTVFKSADILKNGINMSLFLSSDFDIPLLSPQVNMISQEEMDSGEVSLNILDPQIKPYKTFFVYNTEVSNCPIEIVEESSSLFNQIHKLLANDGISQVKFVDEITDAPEWEEVELLKVKTEYQDLNIDNLTKNLTISAKLKNYKAAKAGLIGIAKVGNVLLVSNNLLKNKMSFTESFFKEYDLFNEHNIALINNKFKYSYDLSVDELDTCLLYNYLTPIKNSQNSIIGYKFNDHNISQGSINNKVIKSGVWDLDGKYLSTTKITPSNLFLENINTMVNYSYKLDDEVKLCFGKLNV